MNGWNDLFKIQEKEMLNGVSISKDSIKFKNQSSSTKLSFDKIQVLFISQWNKNLLNCAFIYIKAKKFSNFSLHERVTCIKHLNEEP